MPSEGRLELAAMNYFLRRTLARIRGPASVLSYVGIAALAFCIFIFDTLTSLEVAAPTLYVAVVLLSARLIERKHLFVVAAFCMGLTMLSYALTPGGVKQSGLVNTAISLAVIALSTFLIAEAETAKLKARILLQSEEVRDAVIGSVSHELKTPLTSILGAVSVLAETPSVKADQRLSTLISAVRDEAARLNGDIQNLLDAARISDRGFRTRVDWTDPQDVIGAAVTGSAARYSDRKIEVDAAPDVPLVRIDPVLVHQALYQVIGNAVKFSPSESVIHIKAYRDEDRFVIAVRDEGVGLTPEETEQATQRFFRGRRHIGRIPGSGLGLWIASTFVRTSGGTLRVTSEGEGKGATVLIAFPIPHDAGAERIKNVMDSA